MEPVTHVLTGAVLARTGFNRRAAYATAAMAIAAEFPDIDTLWSLDGPLASFQHHRGITHTLIGIPFEAALITAGFYAWHHFATKKLPKAPIRWLDLYACTLLALLSHILLDWTNNYGVRPFFPFNPRWYAGSFVFIFEPVLFALLLLALIAPLLFNLISSEVGSRRQAFPGRGWPIVSLLAILALWLFRAGQHGKAIDLAQQKTPASLRTLASPYPFNPFLWHTVTETPAAYQLAEIDTRTRQAAPGSPSDTVYQPAATLPLLAAKRTWLGQIYLDWSPMPILPETSDTQDPTHPLSVVTFSDPRFMYPSFLGDGREHPPISAQVTLDMQAPEGQRVVEIRMNGTLQK
jgi:inner membrane protein